jgi:hypothetical protein
LTPFLARILVAFVACSLTALRAVFWTGFLTAFLTGESVDIEGIARSKNAGNGFCCRGAKISGVK